MQTIMKSENYILHRIETKRVYLMQIWSIYPIINSTPKLFVISYEALTQTQTPEQDIDSST